MANGLKRLARHRDRGGAPSSDMTGVSELDLIDVTLVTEMSGKPAEVARLGLGFDETGMAVRRTDGTTVARIPWTRIVRLSTDEVGRSRRTSSTAVALEVRSDKKQHRFLVPNVQRDALTGSLVAMSAKYGRAELATSKGHRPR